MKKGGLAAILLDKLPPPGKMKKGDAEESAESDAEEKDEDVGLESAAADLIAAVKKGDAKGVVSALKDAFEMLG